MKVEGKVVAVFSPPAKELLVLSDFAVRTDESFVLERLPLAAPEIPLDGKKAARDKVQFKF